MKKNLRILGWLALLAGVALVFFELRNTLRSGGIERVFWLIVGALLITFGLVDLLVERPGSPLGK